VDAIQISAPAKVNLILRVLGRRLDGYHDIQSLMVVIDLTDELTVRPTNDSQIKLDISGIDLDAGPTNLIYRAAKAFIERFKTPSGVAIHLKKRIPLAAGLGGGSSDAAAVLAALASISGIRDRGALFEIAAGLGADVPFFLFGHSAKAEGIGEKLYPCNVAPNIPILIANPGVPISTKEVYQNLNMSLTKKGFTDNFPTLVGSARHAASVLTNDLEGYVLQKYADVAKLKEYFIGAGALGSLMSGSGSSVFGVFENHEDAVKIAEILREKAGLFAQCCVTLGEDFPGPWHIWKK